MARLSDSITYGNHAVTGNMDIGGNVDILGSLNVGGVLFQEPTITLTGDVSGSGTVSGGAVTFAVTVADDSHTHDGRYYTETESDDRYYTKTTSDTTFLGITAKASDSDLLDGLEGTQFLRSDVSGTLTGDLTVDGFIKAGTATGGPALTYSDGKGASNLTFNHASGIPDFTGSAARIEVTTNVAAAAMMFELGDSVTSGVDVVLTECAKLDLAAGFELLVGSFIGNGDGLTSVNAATVGTYAETQLLKSEEDDTYTGTQLTLQGRIEVPDAHRDKGMFGTYDSTKTQHIWSMGSAYTNSPTGVDFGTLYGLAYKHTNNTTGGTMAGGHQVVFCSNGVGTAALGTNLWTSGDVIAYSDRRVKTNIELIGDALNKVKRLNGYTFDRLDTKEVGRQTGVIAQEVLAVLPEAVRGDEEHYSVAYGNMVGLLIEAIKELDNRLERMEIN